MELKELNRLIKGLRQRRDGNRQAIQTVLVACIEHANDTGDCTPAMRAVRAVESRLRAPCKTFLGLYSPILVVIGKTVNDDKCRFRKEEQDGYNAFNIDGARANNWWEVSVPKEAPVMGFTQFREATQRLLKKWNKAIEDGKVVEGEVESIKADIAKLHEAIAENGKREATPAMNKYDDLPDEQPEANGNGRLVAPPIAA